MEGPTQLGGSPLLSLNPKMWVVLIPFNLKWSRSKGMESTSLPPFMPNMRERITLSQRITATPITNLYPLHVTIQAKRFVSKNKNKPHGHVHARRFAKYLLRLHLGFLTQKFYSTNEKREHFYNATVSEVSI